MDKSSKFFQISRDIVCEFLQTTVIADDLSQYHEYPKRVSRSPGRGAVNEKTSENETRVVAESAEVQDRHVLRADLVINGFAKKGIICSVLEPNGKHQDYKNTLINLVGNADIFVLDWELEKSDEGKLALEILTDTIGKSNKYPGQLRLIVIYTGEPDIHKVSRKIQEQFNGDIIPLNDFSFKLGSTRIAIYLKPHGFISQELLNRKIEFENLVDTVIDEFTEMTAGLVTNTVLKTLSVVRQNTDKMLNNFSKELDPPFLTHRILLPDKEDAEQYLIELILEEIRAILEETRVRDVAGYNSIKHWFGLNKFQSLEIRLNDQKINIDKKEKALKLLSEGIKALIDKRLGKKKQEKLMREFDNSAHKFNLTKIFGNFNDTEADRLDMMFAHISCTRKFYSESTPILKLGTIIKFVDNDAAEYYLCMQPLCDCVRLEKERSFPFLPLTVIINNTDSFDIVLKTGSEYLRFRCIKKPHSIKMINFSPDERKKVVYPTKDSNGIYWFTDTSTPGKQYSWQGELTWAQSQRLANQVGENLSRVGLDESEWLRRWATK